MYTAYQLGRAFGRPVHAWAAATRAFWSSAPLTPALAPIGRLWAATGEMVERATRFYDKPPFDLPTTTIDGREVAVSERTVLDTPFCKLLHFQRAVAVERNDPRVLLIAPLSGHHASLLRDTVATLLPDHDVYITDWVDARLVPLAAGRFDLDDYIDLVVRFMEKLGPRLHVVAVCQPAVPALAAVALMSEDQNPALPRTLTIMGGPVDTRINQTGPGKLSDLWSLDVFEAALVHRVPIGQPGFLRRVYPGFIQLSAFLGMNPDRHAGSQAELFRDLVSGDEAGAEAHRRFYDDYLAVMDVPAEYYLQTVATVFQRHDLARGEMRYRGDRRIRPETITGPALMTIEGQKDDITGVGQTAAAHALCSAIPAERHVEHVQEGAGHYGLFSGRRWRDEIAPRLGTFIRTHD